jgi:hypothetical protein
LLIQEEEEEEEEEEEHQIFTKTVYQAGSRG